MAHIETYLRLYNREKYGEKFLESPSGKFKFVTKDSSVTIPTILTLLPEHLRLVEEKGNLYHPKTQSLVNKFSIIIIIIFIANDL